MKRSELVIQGVVAFALGVTLSRIGFSSWDEVHRMLTLTDLRLILVFGLAVAILALAWVIVRRVSAPRWGDRPIHKGTILGGVLFGVGWALSGACPAIAMVALGEGQLGALATIGGIVAGNWLFGTVQQRYLRWDTKTCADD